MIKAEILYTVECDRCKGLLDDGEFQYWVETDMAVDRAKDSEWLIKGNKHYCPKCYTLNDEDEEEIKSPIPEQVFELQKFLSLVTKRGCTVTVKEENNCFVLSALLGTNTLSDTATKMICSITLSFVIYISVINSLLKVKIMK